MHRCTPGVVPFRLQVPVVRVEVRRLQEKTAVVAPPLPQRVLYEEDQGNSGRDGGENQMFQGRGDQ